jgi:hypothetical protein
MQLRQGGVPFSGIPNYKDVSMIDMAVCDTGLQMCRQSLYNPVDEILTKGMIFNTMSEMKLFLQDYVVYHHRPYTITHSDRELRYHIICKNGFPCMWRLTARKKQSDGKWRISKVVQPHTCMDNKGKEYHLHSLHVTLPVVYWGSLTRITMSRYLIYRSPYPNLLSMM